VRRRAHDDAEAMARGAAEAAATIPTSPDGVMRLLCLCERACAPELTGDRERDAAVYAEFGRKMLVVAVHAMTPDVHKKCAFLMQARFDVAGCMLRPRAATA
jgi:hypothetical protein